MLARVAETPRKPGTGVAGGSRKSFSRRHMHGFANPARFVRIARWLTPLLLVAGLLLTAGALAWGLFKVPPERLQGETVRIIFVHVPTAWLGMAGGWRSPPPA